MNLSRRHIRVMRMMVCLLLICNATISNAQAHLEVHQRDTVKSKPFASKKIIVYKYHNVSILLSYDSVKKHSTFLGRDGRYRSNEARIIQARLDREIAKSDTAYMDQEYFISINWIPYEDFLCDQLVQGACLVRDAKGKLHKKIVLEKATMHNDEFATWGGVLFYLPGQEKCFIKKTTWVS